jgi:HK97 family phage prohead protease
MMQVITRDFALDDLVVRTEGGGRIVEAYAAVFGREAEIRDFDGHYKEVLGQHSFDGAIKRGAKVGFFFNHGKDIYGNPSDRFSLPIGSPQSISADARGLLTVSRVADTPLGDEVLTLMRDGAIDGFSFSGRPLKSERQPARGGGLPTIVRTELSLREYGPAVFRAYDDARVMALRSTDQIADELGELPPDQLAELSEVLRLRAADPASGRSDGARDADDTDLPPAVSEFDRERRDRAARLRGLNP